MRVAGRQYHARPATVDCHSRFAFNEVANLLVGVLINVDYKTPFTPILRSCYLCRQFKARSGIQSIFCGLLIESVQYNYYSFTSLGSSMAILPVSQSQPLFIHCCSNFPAAAGKKEIIGRETVNRFNQRTSPKTK